MTAISDAKIIKIIQVKTKDRIALPKEARELLKVDVSDHVAFLEDKPGIRVVKVKLDTKE